MSLVLRSVSKTVGPVHHIREVSLRLEAGSLNVLLGPTLSGKTSLMRLMAGLDAPSSGTIEADGKDVTGVPVRDRGVAMVYQQFINYPTLSVYENIASPLRVAKLPRGEIDKRVQEAARLLKLTPMLQRLPSQLSGGQQQRTAIARALVKQARLVLMDEPLANLDYKLREELREELPRIFAQSGAIFVYATTEPSEALLLGGNTATLHQGEVSQFGPSATVYRKPANLAAAQVFSDPPLNTIEARCASGRWTVGRGQAIATRGLPQGADDGGYLLAFRAHQLSFRPLENAALSFSGPVTVSEITGSETFVHMNFEGRNFVGLSHGVHRYEAGAEVTGYVDPADIFIFDSAGQLARLPAAPSLASPLAAAGA